jgi:hypothetical protein
MAQVQFHCQSSSRFAAAQWMVTHVVYIGAGPEHGHRLHFQVLLLFPLHKRLDFRFTRSFHRLYTTATPVKLAIF